MRGAGPVNSAAWRWLTSGVFGLLVGLGCGSALYPVLSWLLGLPDPSGLPGAEEQDVRFTLLAIAALAVQVAVAVVATVLLARVADARRRLGWGCLTLGSTMLLNGAVILLPSGVLGHLTAAHSGQDGNDAAVAALFVLMLSLPFAVLCVGLLAGGALLLRRRAASSR